MNYPMSRRHLLSRPGAVGRRRERVETQVTHPGITDLPDGAWLDWSLSELVRHFLDQARRQGKPAMTRAIMNIYRWNKTRNPRLSQKARRVMDRLMSMPEWQAIPSTPRGQEYAAYDRRQRRAPEREHRAAAGYYGTVYPFAPPPGGGGRNVGGYLGTVYPFGPDWPTGRSAFGEDLDYVGARDYDDDDFFVEEAVALPMARVRAYLAVNPDDAYAALGQGRYGFEGWLQQNGCYTVGTAPDGYLVIDCPASAEAQIYDTLQSMGIQAVPAPEYEALQYEAMEGVAGYQGAHTDYAGSGWTAGYMGGFTDYDGIGFTAGMDPDVDVDGYMGAHTDYAGSGWTAGARGRSRRRSASQCPPAGGDQRQDTGRRRRRRRRR